MSFFAKIKSKVRLNPIVPICIPKEGEKFVILNEAYSQGYSRLCRDLCDQYIYISNAHTKRYFLVGENILSTLNSGFVMNLFTGNLYMGKLFGEGINRIFLLPVIIPSGNKTNRFADSLLEAVSAAKKQVVHRVSQSKDIFEYEALADRYTPVWPDPIEFSDEIAQNADDIVVTDENHPVYQEIVRSLAKSKMKSGLSLSESGREEY